MSPAIRISVSAATRACRRAAIMGTKNRGHTFKLVAKARRKADRLEFASSESRLAATKANTRNCAFPKPNSCVTKPPHSSSGTSHQKPVRGKSKRRPSARANAYNTAHFSAAQAAAAAL